MRGVQSLGEHPQNKEDIVLAIGRYGPYVKCGKVLASLPKVSFKATNLPSMHLSLCPFCGRATCHEM